MMSPSLPTLYFVWWTPENATPDLALSAVLFYAYNAPHEFLYAGMRAPKTLNVPEMGNYHREDAQNLRESSEPVPVDSAHGCAFAVKRAALADIKGFDPAFFAVHEEVDFCMRAREAGWKVAALATAVVAHKVGASFGKQSANRVYYDVRNRVRYFANRAQAGHTRLPMQFWARYLIQGVGERSNLCYVAKKTSQAPYGRVRLMAHAALVERGAESIRPRVMNIRQERMAKG